MSSAGDINADGFDDLIIGASQADPNGNAFAGVSYVIFGKREGFASMVNLAEINGFNGFRINGEATLDLSGNSVSSAGDVNADGFDDLLIGAKSADRKGRDSGVSYVVFGKASGFAVALNLSDLNGSDGFKMNGAAASDYFGQSVSAGDVNGDGFDDLLIGALGASPNGIYASGASYVTFGRGVAVNVNDAAVDEGDGETTALHFTVSLSEAGTVPVTVGVTAVDGTAHMGSDYAQIDQPVLTFAPSETSKTVTINVTGDTLYESDETLSIVLSEFKGGVIRDGIGIGTIRNNDAPPVVSIAGGSALEGDDGTSSLSFTVSLSTASGLLATVEFASADGTALDGSDYTVLKPGTLHFAPGETTKTIAVDVMGDTNVEAHETFSVVFSSPTNATIANDTGTGTILNDDTLLRITDAGALEGHTGTHGMTFTVSLSAPTALPVSVTVATADGTATAGSDYVALTPGILNFEPGEMSKTVTVDVIGDTVVEPSETFSILLSAATNAVLDHATGVDTILDDDVRLHGKRSATFADVDGDLVTIKVSKGTLKVEDFIIVPSGSGAQLALVDFRGQTELAGANLSVTAKRAVGTVGRVQLVDVGAINASGIDLGKVMIKGDVGQINAGNDLDPRPGLLSLSAHSLGRRGLDTQLSGGSLQSEIAGSFKTLKLADGMQDATLAVSGDLSTIDIKGSVLGGAIRSDGKVRAIKITGDLAASAMTAATISARGTLAPTSDAKALAIGALSIGGSVDHAEILAGYDRTGAAVNADAALGRVTVGGNWTASNLTAGVSSGADGMFGTDDDVLIPGGNQIIARIASVVIKGTVSGTESGTDHFGFVAQQFAAFSSAGVRLTLLRGPSNDLTGLPVGATGGVKVREAA